MDTRVLKEIGLTDSEIKVYTALLELGSTKKGPLVKKAGIASSKIYEIMDKLIEKGLASYVIKDKVKYFNPSPPSRIIDYIEEKQEILKKQEEKLKKILPLLESKKKASETEPDAEVYRGWNGMKTVYNDLLRTLKSGEEYMVFGASRGEDERKVRAFFSSFNKNVKKRGLKGKIIFNENARGNIPNVEKTAKVKYIEQTTPAEILIYSNKTAVVLLEKTPLVILIKSQKIADSFRKYFTIMWKTAKK